MDNVSQPSADDMLIAELQAAYEGWMELCAITAREDGISPEVLEQELCWMRWRLKELRRSGNRDHIQKIIQSIANAQAWVQNGRSTGMRAE